mgnify:CR=1 FL=1
MTMAASVEGRVPLLDHRVVEFMFSLPDVYKVDGPLKKCLLKNVMMAMIPKTILNRKKEGFGAPVSYWIDEILARERPFAWLNDLVPASPGRVGSFDMRRESSQFVFGLFVFDVWYNEVFKKA